MSAKKNLNVIIPAAGLSSRMKSFKPLLPLGKTTLLGRAISLFRRNNIEKIIVVLGHRSRELVSFVEAQGASWCLNNEYENGMFSSILTGINALDENCDGFFLLPADTPTLRSHTVKQIKEAFEANPGHIIYPVFNAVRGHPPVIPTRLINEIKNFKGDGGLRACLDQCEKKPVDFFVPDRGILMDADTPENYQAIVEKFNQRHLPEREECLCLMNTCDLFNHDIRAHCMAVELVVVKLARMLKPSMTFNVKRLSAAALLHDIARKEPCHGPAGAALLKTFGFDDIAPLVACHMDIDVNPHAPLTESELVFFADKLVQGRTVVMDVEKRFMEKKLKYSKDPQAIQAIEQRLAAMKIIRSKIEKKLGSDLSEVLSVREKS